MYKIDWKQYLSPERFRTSNFNGNNEGKQWAAYSTEHRTPFESDFGRVAFSSAVRRMHDKTQVMPLTSGDSVHTRLTHCVEVMSIAYSLGIDLCRDEEFRKLYTDGEIVNLERDIPMILKTAAFVHDIGNPPFGHFGETVIQDYFKGYLRRRQITDAQALDFIHFDGNAEGFRILTRLQYIGDLAGLNLTYATLATYTKYPNIGDINKKYIGSKKHGIFTSEKEIFDNMVEKCNLKTESGKIKRHPLSFLLEASDSICYYIMDIEDGFTMEWYTFDEIVDFLNKKYDEDGSKTNILDKLNLTEKLEKYKHDDRRKMTEFRVATVSYLVDLAIKRFKEHLEEIDKGKYSEELIEDNDNLAKYLGSFAKAYIYPNPQIEQIELTGHSVLTGLFEKLLYYAFNQDKNIRNRLKSIISKTSLRIALHTNDNAPTQYIYYDRQRLNEFDFEELDEYGRLRLIVDFISGMTDKFAVLLYQKLSGLKL